MSNNETLDAIIRTLKAAQIAAEQSGGNFTLGDALPDASSKTWNDVIGFLLNEVDDQKATQADSEGECISSAKLPVRRDQIIDIFALRLPKTRDWDSATTSKPWFEFRPSNTHPGPYEFLSNILPDEKFVRNESIIDDKFPNRRK